MRAVAFAGLAIVLFAAGVVSAVAVLEARVAERVHDRLSVAVADLREPLRQAPEQQERLAQLEQRIGALETRLERIAGAGGLERSADELVAGWEELDRSLRTRQSELLADLDGHAATLEERATALVEALDVMVAESAR